MQNVSEKIVQKFRPKLNKNKSTFISFGEAGTFII